MQAHPDGLGVPAWEADMAELAGVSVFVLGQLSGCSRRHLRRLVADAGGRLSRRMSTRVTLIVAAASAARAILTDSPLLDAIDRAPDNANLVSERTFKRWLRLLPPQPETATGIGAESLLHLAGLDPETLFWLELFDVVDGLDDSYSYADLLAAREVRRLLDAGCDLTTILEAAVALKRGGVGLGQARLQPTTSGRVLRRVDDRLVGIDGQWELPLDEYGCPIDALLDGVETAEEAGDLDGAERLLQAAVRIDRRDAVLRFRLAQVQAQRGDVVHAGLQLQAALALEPGFSEAWAALGLVLEARGRDADAALAYEAAVEIDPELAEGYLRLGLVRERRGEDSAASRAFARCIAVDGAGVFGGVARERLAGVRVRLRTGRLRVV